MPKLVRHFKVDARLTEEERREYERLLMTPTTTRASLKRWLEERGYHDVSDGAIQRHRRYCQRDLLDIRRQAQAAHHFTMLARGMDTSGLLMADAAQLRLEQVFFQALHTIPQSASDAATHFGALAKVLLDVLKARRSLEQARSESGRAGGGAGDAMPDSKVDPQARGEETSRRVREALGMACPQGVADPVLDAVELRVRELLPIWKQREQALPRVPLTDQDKAKWAKHRRREASVRYRRGDR